MPYEKRENHPDCPVSKPWAVVKSDDGEVMGCHASEKKADAQIAALYANEAGMAIDFLFVELSEGKPVEVLRVGDFIDRFGRPVPVTLETLDAVVANFAAGAAEQEVPVDVDHGRAEAAGWVTRLWREGERLLATVDWNELGARLVGGRVYRYISVTLDTEANVIRTVSLTNFPAVKGLAPVELSDGAHTFERGGVWTRFRTGLERVVAEVFGEGPEADLSSGDNPQVQEVISMAKTEEEIREEERARVEAELAQQRQRAAEEKAHEAELREKVRGEVEAELKAKMAREASLAEFAASVCGGAQALSVPPDQVTAFLSGLTPEQVEQAKALLTAKRVDLTEHGSTREGRGALKKLEGPYVGLLRTWLKDKRELGEFFAINRDELGEMSEYDLSEFSK